MLQGLDQWHFELVTQHCICTAAVEPGYYEDGRFGIRIESLLLIVEANTPVCQLQFDI